MAAEDQNSQVVKEMLSKYVVKKQKWLVSTQPKQIKISELRPDMHTNTHTNTHTNIHKHTYKHIKHTLTSTQPHKHTLAQH